jgi:hypothetical protein
MTIALKRTSQLSGVMTLLSLSALAAAAGPVSIERLPAGALQPQAVQGDDGAIHLVWLTGEPGTADIVYQRRAANNQPPAAPVRVNSQPGSAIAIGTVRGARIALGKAGRVHVVWNGSSSDPQRPSQGAALFYSRLDNTGKKFDPQRNLLGKTAFLDGGASVAADGAGRVFVCWHAAPSIDSKEMTERRVFVARSDDDGASFAPEQPAGDAVGACGCCGLTAAAAGGHACVLFRDGKTTTQRDMTLLVSNDGGQSFSTTALSPWQTAQCPMSTSSLLPVKKTMWAAWETEGRISVGSMSPESGGIENATLWGEKAKHPALAANRRGEVLVVWTEGTGWERGGSIAWQMFDAKGKPTGEIGRQDGLPAWSFAAAYARPDGGFRILF